MIAAMFEHEIDIVFNVWIPVTLNPPFTTNIVGRGGMVYVRAGQLHDDVSGVNNSETNIYLIHVVFIFFIETTDFKQCLTPKRGVASQKIGKSVALGGNRAAGQGR